MTLGKKCWWQSLWYTPNSHSLLQLSSPLLRFKNGSFSHYRFALMVYDFFKAPRTEGGFIPFAVCSDTQVKQSQAVRVTKKKKITPTVFFFFLTAKKQLAGVHSNLFRIIIQQRRGYGDDWIPNWGKHRNSGEKGRTHEINDNASLCH